MGTPSDAFRIVDYAEVFVGDFQDADLYEIYAQLLIVNSLLKYVVAFLVVILAVIVLVLVLKTVNNIFKNI